MRPAFIVYTPRQRTRVSSHQKGNYMAKHPHHAEKEAPEPSEAEKVAPETDEADEGIEGDDEGGDQEDDEEDDE